MIVKELNKLVRAVAPIHGVSAGVVDDKTTWRIDFADEATAEQRDAAAAVLSAFEIGKATHNADLDAQIASLEAARPGYVRGIREFMLGVVSLICVVLNRVIGQVETELRRTNPACTLDRIPDIAVTPGMQNVKALDDQIKALRAQRQ